MIGLLGITAGLLVAWLITVGVAQLISEFFRESVITAVEARHYPELPPPSRLSVGSELVSGLRFIAVLVLANLLALPFYLLAIFIPGLTPVLFYTVNGYLFGREYYDLVAQRRLGLPASRSLRRRNRGHLFLVGVVIAIMFSIPLVNLVAPILASAFMVHEFQDLPRGDI